MYGCCNCSKGHGTLRFSLHKELREQSLSYLLALKV